MDVHYSIFADNVESLQFLIGKGLNVNSYIQNDQLNVLDGALQRGNIQNATFLVNNGAMWSPTIFYSFEMAMNNDPDHIDQYEELFKKSADNNPRIAYLAKEAAIRNGFKASSPRLEKLIANTPISETFLKVLKVSLISTALVSGIALLWGAKKVYDWTKKRNQ